jgi:hypothetical protein
MRCVAAVGIDNDLAAGQSAIAVGAADHEIAGRVDQEIGRPLRHPALRQCGGHGVADQVLDHGGRVFLPVASLGIVLGRDHDLGASDGLAVDVLHCHLALGVRLQVEQLLRAALLGQHLEDLVREVDRGGHERALLVDLALGASEAEHHALVAGSLLLLALLLLGIDAHGDVGRLSVQQHLDVGAVIGEAVLVVSDVAHHVAGDLRDHFAIDHRVVAVLGEQRRLAAAFPGNDDLVGGAERLAAEPGIHQAVIGDAELDVVLDEGVENGIRNLVADLVGVAFGNRLAGEQVVDMWH